MTESKGGPSGKPLVLGAAALVVAGAAALFALLPRKAPTQRSAASAVPEAPAPVEPAPAPVSKPPPVRSAAPVLRPASVAPATSSPPVDLFAGEQPELFAMGQQVLEQKGRLNVARLKELYEWGKAHPGDARPHILMAIDSMNRDWWAFPHS